MSNNLGDNFEEREIGKNDNVTDSGSDEDEKNCCIETCNENVVEVDDKENSSFGKLENFVTEEDGQSIIKLNTSKTKHKMNDTTAEEVKRQEIEEDGVNNDESVPDLTNKLTHDELLILFSWLPLDDLVTVRRVCHSWRVAAQDKFLWRNRILYVRSGSEYQIKLMPNIENMRGHGENTLIYTILDNVIKLKTLNVRFKPPISSSKVELVAQKYPELESITLNRCDRGILKSLNILKSSRHLKEIYFHLRDAYGVCLSEFMNVLTDSNNFLGLTALNLFRYSMECPRCINALCKVINNRSQQLLVLRLSFPDPDTTKIFDAISHCIKLQTLKLITESVNTNLNIERMTQLKSLYLRLTSPCFTASENQDLNFLTSVKDSLYKGSWSKLTEVNITVNIYVTMCLLRAIIDNAKSLKTLKYIQHGFYISDDQLEDINTLVNLEGLELRGVQNITEKGICYITECHRLKNILLVSAHLDVSFNSNCIKEMLLQLKNLQSFRILKEGDGYTKLFLENRQEIERHFASIGSQYH